MTWKVTGTTCQERASGMAKASKVNLTPIMNIINTTMLSATTTDMNPAASHPTIMTVTGPR